MPVRAFDAPPGQHAVRAPTRPAARRSPGRRRCSCSSRPASRSWPSTTTRTSCSSTAPPARSSTRSPRARSARRTRRGARTATRVAYVGGRPRVPQGHGEARRGRDPADLGRGRVLRPRVGADRRRQPARHGAQQGRGPRPLPRPDQRRRDGAALHPRPGDQRRQSRSTGRPTASRSSPSAWRPTTRRSSASCAGARRRRSRRTRATGARAASSPTRRRPNKGVHRRGALAGRQAARAGVEPRVETSSGSCLAKPNDFAADQRQGDVGARLQGRVAQRRPGARRRAGRRELPGAGRARSCGCAVKDPTKQTELNASGDNPVFQPLDARGVAAVLCPSCRRQLDRGASYCGSCGTPLAGGGGAARARAGRRDARARRGRDDDRPRARLDRCSSTTRRSRGCTRGSPATAAGARGDRGRRLEPRDVDGRRARHGPDAAARRRRGSASATRSCASSAAATPPRRGARSSCGRARASSSRPPGAPGVVELGHAVRHAPARALGLRAQAAGGGARATGAGCSRTSRAAPFLRLSDNDAQLFEQLDGTRSLADLIGEAEQRFGADRARRGWRGCWPTSASAASSAASSRRRPGTIGGAAGAAGGGCCGRARSTFARVGPCVRDALPARRLGAVHAAGAGGHRSRSRRPASACSAT